MQSQREKCFDNLWLEDCLVDMWKAGMREREVMMLLKLNEKTKMEIDTPYGKTKELENIVKQGTVYGPQLCCVSTDKVNTIGEMSMMLVAPTLKIQSTVFVDDIMAGGNIEAVEAAGRNLKKMEEEKGYTFNVAESKTLYMYVGKKRNEREPEITLKKGMVTRKEEYKYTWETG